MEHVTEELLAAFQEMRTIGLDGMVFLMDDKENDIGEHLSSLRVYGHDVKGLVTTIDSYTQSQPTGVTREFYELFEPLAVQLTAKARAHVLSCPTCLERYCSNANLGRDKLEILARALASKPDTQKLAQRLGKDLRNPYLHDPLNFLNAGTPE